MIECSKTSPGGFHLQIRLDQIRQRNWSKKVKFGPLSPTETLATYLSGLRVPILNFWLQLKCTFIISPQIKLLIDCEKDKNYWYYLTITYSRSLINISKLITMSNLKQFESREAVSPSPLDMTDSLRGQSGIGDSKKIATKDPDRIRILYEARFRQTCWDSKSTMKRKYFYLLENGYETSNPYGLNCICFKIPGNVCCPGYDSITKTVSCVTAGSNFCH